MIPLDTVYSPTTANGRPPMSGTILADPNGGRYTVVRCAYSCGENTGGCGSQRVEVWVALSHVDFAPIVVRGAGWQGSPLKWSALEGWSDIGVRRDEVLDALRWATHHDHIGDILLGPSVEAPTTIWDRRVVLPDDSRYPKNKHSVKDSLRVLLAKRNTCPDDQVPAIDAMIMNLAPREDA